MPQPLYNPLIQHSDSYLTDFRTGLSASTTDLGGGNGSAGKVGVDLNIAGVGGTTTPAGSLPIVSKATISTVNSSTTPLGANVTFTGTFELMDGNSSIAIILNSDSLLSSPGCLNVDFSTNGTDVDRTVNIGMPTGGAFCTVASEAAYYRIRVTAGSSPQTYMRLQTRLMGSAEGLKATPLSDNLTDSSTALVSRSVIIGKTTAGGGDYISVKVNPSGTLTVDASNSTGLVLSPSAAATGCLVNRQTALTNTAVLIKGSAGAVYGYNCYNPNTSVAFVHLYNAATAGAVTVGTTVPVISIPLTSGVSSQVADRMLSSIPMTSFSAGLVIAASTTATGGTAPTTALFAQVFYQ